MLSVCCIYPPCLPSAAFTLLGLAYPVLHLPSLPSLCAAAFTLIAFPYQIMCAWSMPCLYYCCVLHVPLLMCTSLLSSPLLQLRAPWWMSIVQLNGCTSLYMCACSSIVYYISLCCSTHIKQRCYLLAVLFTCKVILKGRKCLPLHSTDHTTIIVVKDRTLI